VFLVLSPKAARAHRRDLACN